MIANCRNSVLADRELHLTLLERFNRELYTLRNYTHYTLFALHHNKHDYYTLVDNKSKPHTRKYLGTRENHTVQLIQKRRFLEESLDRIKSNLELMDFLPKNTKAWIRRTYVTRCQRLTNFLTVPASILPALSMLRHGVKKDIDARICISRISGMSIPAEKEHARNQK